MKYVAVFEIPDDKAGLLELTLPTSDGLTVTSLIEFKKAPEEQPVLVPCEYRENDYAEGYNQALKDCGVIEDDN